MSAIFDGYLTEEERALAIEESTINNQIDKLFDTVKMVDMTYAMNCHDAELKVLTESGTYDDLGALYEAAANDQSDKKKSLLDKIGEGIKHLIDMIGSQITNFCNWISGKNRSSDAPPRKNLYCTCKF